MGILKKGDTEIKLVMGKGFDMLQARVDATNSCRGLFCKFDGTNLDFVKNLDTSKVTDMSFMFDQAYKIKKLDLSNFNTSNVINMENMFATGHTRSMSGTTHTDSKLETLTFGKNFNTSNVRNMSYMFYRVGDVDLDLSNFDTSKVSNMTNMFYEYQGDSLDVTNFNTSNVTSMSGMFQKCSLITTLDVSKFNTSKVTDMSYMFYECFELKTLDVSNFDTSKLTSVTNMFRDCRRLTELNLSSFDTSRAIGVMSFAGCYELKNIIGTLDMISMNSLTGMFTYCYALESVTLKNIKKALQIGSRTTWGHLLDDPTVINTAKELWDLTGATSQVLTVSTPTDAKFDTIYVKLIEATDEMIADDPNIIYKKPCEVCESTDEGAMTLREYIISKNWTISK